MSGLGSVLGLPDGEPVVVHVGPWSELRAMQTSDGTVKFKQVRLGDRWYLYDLIDPLTGEWYKIEAAAVVLGLPSVVPMWHGPLDRIPKALLLSDETIMLRSKRKPGWLNLKRKIGEACEDSV